MGLVTFNWHLDQFCQYLTNSEFKICQSHHHGYHSAADERILKPHIG